MTSTLFGQPLPHPAVSSGEDLDQGVLKDYDENDNETVNVESAMDSNIFRSSKEFGQTLPHPDVSSGEDLDQGVLEDYDENEDQGGLDDTAEIREINSFRMMQDDHNTSIGNF